MRHLLNPTVLAIAVLMAGMAQAKDIVHDTEYLILEKQHSEQWAKDDAAVDKKLAAFRKQNGGKSPNIPYILIDDIGFGDLGSRN